MARLTQIIFGITRVREAQARSEPCGTANSPQARLVCMDTVDVAVIGAGVIGLAIARALAMTGREVLVLEAAENFGAGTSSRNSEVIHAGIYYRPDSLKARFCRAGRERLYEFCERHGVPHRRCGKLIVASSKAKLDELSRIGGNARANGVHLESWSEARVASLEPRLHCAGALFSPDTGIIDSHAYMLALLGEAERLGATLVCASRVTGMRADKAGVTLCVNGEPPVLRARTMINSAGLNAPQLARAIAGFPAMHVPETFLAKGSYFSLEGPSPFGRLVYPVPEPGGLGIHLTLDLAGRARFGPDVEWVKECDYAVDPRRADRFYPAIRTYWPGLPDGSLRPAYAGIRPKLSPAGAPAQDFRIDGAEVHGVAGVINLFGIESPGLTASLAIADAVTDRLRPVLSR